MPTKIEWADETWSVVTGCTPVSEGCRNCYAARMAATRLRDHPRYKGLAVMHDSKPKWTGKINLNHDVLEQPLHWRKPRRVFVASMGDLFHKDVPAGFIYDVFLIMTKAPHHTFQVLTKHPRRMRDFIYAWSGGEIFAKMQFAKLNSNVWLGTSVENQATADERIKWLLQTPAAVRFVSVEPILGLVDLTYLESGAMCALTGWHTTPGNSGCETDGFTTWDEFHEEPIQHIDGQKLDWVICGGESGPGARLMDEDWVRDLRDQCVAAGTPFFYKQVIRNGRRVHIPELDGQVWDQFPKCEGKLSGWLGKAGGGR